MLKKIFRKALKPLQLAGLKVLCFWSVLSTSAQQGDTLYLLSNKHVEYEATVALDSMYNFNFEAARIRFVWLKQEYPTHPLPYFLLGLNTWWQMESDTKARRYDIAFISYMDTTLYLAKRLMRQGVTTEGSFFLSGAYALLGRFYGERESWLRAAWAGRNALKYLEICRRKKYLSSEILLGDALYNYYSVWIRENYPQLRPILSFFKKGNQALGLQQLDYVAKNSFYTRIEAQHFLMNILNEEDTNKTEALHIADYLHGRYPNNAYFHSYYARILYELGKYSRCKKICEEVLRRKAAQAVGYGGNSARYCSFFLGWIHQYIRHEPQKAVRYYQLSLRYAQAAKALHMGYTLHALIALGDIAAEQKRYETATAYYKKAAELAERRSQTWKRARKRYQDLRKQHKKLKK